MNELTSKRILPLIVFSQFFCTSLWFAVNGVIDGLLVSFNLEESALGSLTAAVQFGFIIGTLFFSLLSLADRYSPSKVFCFSALAGALINLLVLWSENTFASLLFIRFAVGFFLAGIYPVGMKIAADYFDKGLGRSLGFLVGALVLGTAFPHFLRGANSAVAWQYGIIATSVFAIIGGLLIFFFVPDGPYRKAGKQISLTAGFQLFRNRNFSTAALGYFGHMWELYAFWAFVPVMLKSYAEGHSLELSNISMLSFYVIGIGGLSCIASGILSERLGVERTAFISLILSFCCCLIFPFIFSFPIKELMIAFLLFWGIVVIADSPLFSTLVAKNAPEEIRGSAITIVTCIGFFISILSIQLLNYLSILTPSSTIYTLLCIGPLIGLSVWLLRLKSNLF